MLVLEAMGEAKVAATFSTLATRRGGCVYKCLAGWGATLFVVVVYRGFLFEGDFRVDSGSRLRRSSFVGTFVCGLGPVVETVHVLAGETFEWEEIEDVTVFHGTMGPNCFDIAL